MGHAGSRQTASNSQWPHGHYISGEGRAEETPQNPPLQSLLSGNKFFRLVKPLLLNSLRSFFDNLLHGLENML